MDIEEIATIEDLCRSYINSLEIGDLETLLANFSKDATATSPIYGKQLARDFYSYVLREVNNRTLLLKTVFIGTSDPLQAAVHFSYTRTVGNNKPATIECVDVFELTADHSQFAAVTIIYDTAPIQSDFKS